MNQLQLGNHLELQLHDFHVKQHQQLQIQLQIFGATLQTAEPHASSSRLIAQYLDILFQPLGSKLSPINNDITTAARDPILVGEEPPHVGRCQMVPTAMGWHKGN